MYVEYLQNYAQKLAIDVVPECSVKEIGVAASANRDQPSFELQTSQGRILASAVVVATGMSENRSMRSRTRRARRGVRCGEHSYGAPNCAARLPRRSGAAFRHRFIARSAGNCGPHRPGVVAIDRWRFVALWSSGAGMVAVLSTAHTGDRRRISMAPQARKDRDPPNDLEVHATQPAIQRRSCRRVRCRHFCHRISHRSRARSSAKRSARRPGASKGPHGRTGRASWAVLHGVYPVAPRAALRDRTRVAATGAPLAPNLFKKARDRSRAKRLSHGLIFR